jgi:hypothetical protein
VNKNGWDEEDYQELQKLTIPRGRRWKISNYYLSIGKIFIERNFNRKKASVNFIRSIASSPLNGTAWFNFFLLFLPASLIHKWKKMRGM